MQSVGPTSFGDLLRQFRFAIGLTQEALAERAGLSVHGVQKLERGATHPYRDTVKRLALALQLPPKEQVRFNDAARPAPRRRQARPQPAGGSSPHGRAGADLVQGHPSRTPFIGRRRELSLLTERLGSAREGRGGLVVVAGEPGIGKTRLVFELGQRAQSEGWQVLSGRAYDSEGMPPYFPLAEALRAYVRVCRSKELRTRLGRNAADVALVVPEVRDRLPDMPSAPTGIDEYRRYRVFESVSEFLLAIARSAPAAGLLLCLDDLHWADQSTLLLLKYLAQKAPTAPLLVVGAYRTTELTRMNPLADVLADLRRDALSERVLLTSLSAEDTTVLIEGLAGGPASAAAADAIYRETDGQPFFVTEVVRQLQADGRDLADPRAAIEQWGIPEGVREVIGRRLSRLRAASNQLLQAAAVLGEGMTVDVLQAVSGLDGSTLLDALEDAVGAGMLREDGASYAFAHALIRETLYDELSLVRKQRLHRQAGDALVHAHARNLRPHIGTIAVHYRLAGPAAELETALEWARRAGEAAAAVFAWKEAASHWQAALELAAADDSEMRCDLLLALGKVLLPAGQPRRVVDEIAPEALLLAEALGDHRRALQAGVLALEGVGTSGAAGAFYTLEGRAWAECADRYAQPASVERVIADAFRSQTLSPLDQRAERRALHLRSLNLARELSNPEALTYAGIQVLREGAAADWEDRVALAEEFASKPREGIRLTRLVLLLQDCATVLLASGQRVRAENLWHEVETLAKRFQDPNLATQRLRNAALTAVLDGRLDTAVTILGDLVAQAERAGQGLNGRANASAVFLRPLLHLGRAEEALAFYAELRRGISIEASEMYVPAVTLSLAHLGRRDEARENRCALWACTRSIVMLPLGCWSSSWKPPCSSRIA